MHMTEAGAFFTDGNAYERLMGRWSRRAGEQFLDWLAPAKGLSWLDVGCGNGAFTEVLLGRCAPARVLGVDPSPGQLAYARTRVGTERAEFHIGDAQALPLERDSFDAAAMALVLAFLPDPAKAVAEMARVVRPGGWIATYMWDFPSGGSPNQPMHDTIRSMGMAPPGPPNPEASGHDSMRALWANAGLTEVETTVLRIVVEFDDLDDLWASTTSPSAPMGRFVQEMSSGAREELRSRLRQRVPTGPDGRIAYPAVANAVKGRVPR
jgi:SAM-dependent methyltransferase